MKVTSKQAEAIANYCDAEKSDPFVMRRVMAHLKSGIAKADDYAATAVKVTREVDGIKYNAVTYANIRRL